MKVLLTKDNDDPRGENALQSFITGRNINRYKKKQVIYSEGNHPQRLFYIQKGKVKLYKTNEEGKELVMDIYSEGDFLGYMALLEQTTYKESAETMEETELAMIPKEEFEELINNNQAVTRRFISMLAKEVTDMETKLLGMAYNSLRKKVAETLIVLHKKYGKDIDISRENLAAMAGTATESMIRTLSEFKNEKLIDIKEGRIVIPDEKKLGNLLH